MKLKLVFCWTDISGYMCASWRALNALPDIDLFVLAFQALTETAFNDNLMQGIPSRLLDLNERSDTKLIHEIVLAQQPDVVVVCGWYHPPFVQLTKHPKFKQTSFIMGMDTPWQDTFRQKLSPTVLKNYLSRIEHIVVSGERSWQYARRLGFSSDKITRCLYGIDYTSWAPLLNQRQQTKWPQNFLFVGRYVEVKAIDILVQAYQLYRTLVSDPWSLVCCGQGELGHLLEDQPGIQNLGFIQPHAMHDIWRQAGVFVMPSRYDPWPLAIVETAAAGLPIICTEDCGTSVEIVRDWYNGLLVPKNEVKALTDALLTMHHHHADLSLWGTRSQSLAEPFSSEFWAKRWYALLQNLNRSYRLNQVSV